MKRFTLLLSLLMIPLTVVAEENAIDLTPTSRIPVGVYGGNQASVTVDLHSLRLELPCALGRIPARPVLDENGTFRAEGTYGSRMLTNPRREYPASFQGRLIGGDLWIEVDVHGRERQQHLNFGPLSYGQSSRFFRCL